MKNLRSLQSEKLVKNKTFQFITYQRLCKSQKYPAVRSKVLLMLAGFYGETIGFQLNFSLNYHIYYNTICFY